MLAAVSRLFEYRAFSISLSLCFAMVTEALERPNMQYIQQYPTHPTNSSKAGRLHPLIFIASLALYFMSGTAAIRTD